jgi:hypothetical protein
MAKLTAALKARTPAAQKQALLSSHEFSALASRNDKVGLSFSDLVTQSETETELVRY